MGEKILIVDDTQLVRVMYKDKLTAEGYEVECAEDGWEGVQKAQSWMPDLILLDMVMPKMTGLEALQRLKQDPRTRDILVIVLSNRDDDEDIKRGIKLGANDYLRKVGTSPAQVSSKIREMIDQAEPVPVPEAKAFRMAVKDREHDADALLGSTGFPRRFWCQACEEEMVLELLPDPSRESGHWFTAHFVCPKCSREF
ncbi:MAG: response regulator [Actinobacteria bacterium]|nr:MAG: response regulator [Actinomycetota bacterium]